MDRIILHSDMNSFYASVECMENPDLKRIPMVVGGDPENRHGIVLAKNQMAKDCGIQTGEALWAAKQKCPNLTVRPPDYHRYMDFSRRARKIYLRYSDRVEPFGPDEAWVELTGSSVLAEKTPRQVADEIRKTMQHELGLTVSVGVSWNKIFAKFGSDYKKPDAVTEVNRGNYHKIVWERPVGDLLCVGRSTRARLEETGVYTIGALAGMDREELRRMLGKNGEILWYFANGLDTSEVKRLNEKTVGADYEIKSIGNSLTAPRDLVTDEDVKLLLFMLGECVGMRMRECGFRCRTVEIHIRDKELRSFSRQRKLPRATMLTEDIVRCGYALYKENYQISETAGIRSLGIRACNLVPAGEPCQLTLTDDPFRMQRTEDLESVMDRIRHRFGNNAVRRAVTLGDSMSGMDFKADHIVHPVGYFA